MALFRKQRNTILIIAASCCIIFAIFWAKENDYFNQPSPTVVLDGYEWMRCPVGQTLEEYLCAGRAKEFTFDEATTVVSELNAKGGAYGKNDWRVPTVRELASLRVCSIDPLANVEVFDGNKPIGKTCKEGLSSLAFDVELFPNTPDSLWSSSLNIGNAYYAWIVNFSDGKVYYHNKYDYYPIRLVRTKDNPNNFAVDVGNKSTNKSIGEVSLASAKAIQSDPFVGCFANLTSNKIEPSVKIIKEGLGFSLFRLDDRGKWEKTIDGGALIFQTEKVKDAMKEEKMLIESAIMADGKGVIVRLKQGSYGANELYKGEYLAITGSGGIELRPVECVSY